MANEFINGRKTVLFMDTVTPITTALNQVTTENAVMVACLDSNSFNGTTSPIAATSKCSGKFAESIDGEMAFTIAAAGKAIALALGDLRVNHNKLFKQWKSGQACWWFLMDLDAEEDSVTLRYGVGRIDSFDDDFPDNDSQTFTISITGIGEPGDQDDIKKLP